jgi:protein-disulfide isomerase
MSDEINASNNVETKPNESEINSKITINKSTYNNMLKGIVAAIAIATFLGGYSLGTFDNSNSGVSQEELKEIISEIEIKNTPTVQPAQQPTQPTAAKVFKVSMDDDPIKGDPDAEVTVIEFSDFQCPFCSRFYTQTLSQLEENYIDTGKINLVFRDLPLDRLHPNARPAHIAAECADEQKKFWDYHDILFEKQSQWQRLSSIELQTTLTQYASDLGLQTVNFESCLESKEIADEVNSDALAAASLGITGTPSFFIGNEKDGFVKLVGAQPFSAFQGIIDNKLG